MVITETLTEPDLPSLVAVMVADPPARPETIPAGVTLAIDGALLDHTTVRPVSGVFASSTGCANSCLVSPAWSVTIDGVTWTAATTVPETFTDASPALPSLSAEMMVAPVASAVTLPEALTVATAGLLLVHVIGRLASRAPAASRASALKLKLPPTLMLAFAGTSLTLATGTRETVIVERPLFPSMLAATCTWPSLRPVTSPSGDTVTMSESSADQKASRLSRLPSASRASACSVTVAPIDTVATAGTTTTVSTGTRSGSTPPPAHATVKTARNASVLR